ncbi:chemotaxis protein CheD [Leptospira borgpetersenii serovar Hardjo-bovis]|uniref:chemotaxis protein CheD n=2 Tax=Leptospira borgpetersenii TaxID=174 RepID=UPI000348AA00|nr:chemotaxis protein CheD [Leptospira borgpetersenii]AMX58227.1 chemotaxis protein CheD [Leptospira borgpetersenii serovar Hardjo]AMX61479.1 chemotaxis protein CheD [Leptospira borgpetersenii serovar Hardjo]AMX64724.1 chemotaxis protein CheD [Leptospira borgpetersenii serovar Hardjo]AMX67934.1 chemotaxis protein CheD [Leptospira borgpetersenii serovar Hardjo]AWV70092.1 chemotaxis protein CheD [Leptospira borgpetersenii serovar Hardjo-bovis]
MTEPDTVRDIFLQPGGFCWGRRDLRIRTLLGSCVSICFWNPALLYGGMAHVMLPYRPGYSATLNAKYADEAIRLFFEKIEQAEGRAGQYQIKLFGGASMFSTEEEKLLEIKSVRDIGMKNIRSIKELLSKNRLPIASEDLGGGFSHRRIFFSLWDGEIYVERPEFS